MRIISLKMSFLALLITIFTIYDLSSKNIESYSTFHCISLYWKPVDGAADNECKVKYRIEGETEWREGMSLWFDPNEHDGLPERSHEYRGSLVDLIPGTTYVIHLELQKSGTSETIIQTTLDESFDIYKTIKLTPGEQNVPLIISEGGSKQDGYVLYDASGVNHIIDVKKQFDFCVKVDVSYVIIRGLVLKGAKNNGIELENVNNVVIEGCDISGWGSPVDTGRWQGFGVNHNSAIFSGLDVNVSSIVIQRNKLHHPNIDSNSWEEPVPGTHPRGPQGISLSVTDGHNVIRYNEIYSDKDHKFNDGMGNNHNFSYSGFPNRDSDIYCNFVSNCWDDGIEAEGSGMNVRIWGNFVDTTFMGYGIAGQSLGPFYVFRNLANMTQRAPYPIAKYQEGGSFFKIGGEMKSYKYLKGRMILLHNTSLQPPSPWEKGYETVGVKRGLGFSTPAKIQENIMTRNNIFHIRESSSSSIADFRKKTSNTYDYDLYNGEVLAADGNQANGMKGIPNYDDSNGDNEYYLAPSSPGFDDGLIIPNINDSFVGEGPDIGAFEKGLPPIKFGVSADWNEWVDAINSKSTSQK